MRAELLSSLRPSIKVILRRNRASNPLNGPHGPELLESRGALDRRLVDASSLVDVVGSAIRLNRPLLRRSRRRVVRPIRLNDVVLDKGVACPSIERDVAVDRPRVPGTSVVDDLSTSGVPAFASDKVTDVVPLNAVFAGILVVISDGAFTIGPVGVEEAVVGAGALGCGAGDEFEGGGENCGRATEG